MVTTRLRRATDHQRVDDSGPPPVDVLETWLAPDLSIVDVDIAAVDIAAVDASPATTRCVRPVPTVGAVTVVPLQRSSTVMTCLRIALALIWVAGLISHLRGGGPTPCTCPHP